MTDGVTVTLRMTLRSEAAEDFTGNLALMLRDTAKRPGFCNIRIVRHSDDPNTILLVEQWDSTQAYNDYIAWRTERGDMDAMATALVAPPQLDIWPTIVAAA